jgi:hypothetical protein
MVRSRRRDQAGRRCTQAPGSRPRQGKVEMNLSAQITSTLSGTARARRAGPLRPEPGAGSAGPGAALDQQRRNSATDQLTSAHLIVLSRQILDITVPAHGLQMAVSWLSWSSSAAGDGLAGGRGWHWPGCPLLSSVTGLSLRWRPGFRSLRSPGGSGSRGRVCMPGSAGMSGAAWPGWATGPGGRSPRRGRSVRR